MNRTGPIRFCVIGVGRAGLLHARNLAGRVPGATLAALCDADPAALSQAGQELGVSTLLADYRTALARDDLDAVVIVTPTFLHRDMACLAAAQGKHVFLEKPMALSAAECLDILRAAEQGRVRLQIGFMRRFDPGFLQARQVIASGELGQVMIVKSTGRGPGGPGKWMYDLSKSNGIIAEVNSHDLDTLRWLSGQEFHSAFAQAHNFKCPDACQDWPDFYDNVLAQFRMSGQALGLVDGTCPAHYGYDARVEVLCEKGVLFLGDVAQSGLTRVTADGQITGQTVKSWRTLFKDAYLAEMEHFVACLLEDKPPAVTGRDGLRAVEAVAAVNESIRSGAPIRLELEKIP